MIERTVSNPADPTAGAAPSAAARALEAVRAPMRAAAATTAGISLGLDTAFHAALAGLTLGSVPPLGSLAAGYAPLYDAPGAYVRAR